MHTSTPLASGTSSAASHAQLPSSTQQQVTQPPQAPQMRMRLPEASFQVVSAAENSTTAAHSTTATSISYITPTAATPSPVQEHGSQGALSPMPASLLEAVVCSGSDELHQTLAELRQSGKDTTEELNQLRKKSPIMAELFESLRRSEVEYDQRERSDLTALMDAASQGDTATVQALLQAGAEVNTAATLGGKCALILAAENRHAATLQVLIQAGAKIDHVTSRGNTALICAATNGDIASLQLLLQAGAMVDHANCHSATALLYAAKRGETDTVQVLLRAGANIDHADIFGWTSVIYAASQGDTATVQALLDAGANAGLMNKDSDTALLRAVRTQHAEVVKLLLAHDTKTGTRS